MWKVEYLREALEDIKKLDSSQRMQVVKAVNKVAVNPLPRQKAATASYWAIKAARTWKVTVKSSC